MTLTPRTRILVVSDDAPAGDWFVALAAPVAHDVRVASAAGLAREPAGSWPANVVVIDMDRAGADPLEVVDRVAERWPGIDLVAIVPPGATRLGAMAVRRGASCFLDQPIDDETLRAVIERGASRVALQAEHVRLRRVSDPSAGDEAIVGRSRAMTDLLELVAAVASSEANILIQGENGTGKELVANAIHRASGRARGPFVKINCAAIPRDLIESELFGHRRGAFTGATMDRDGLFAAADGGSLLLDEIGEMPAYLQTKLLRVLQEREYRPIGGERQVRTDFRLISSTNVEIETAVSEGRIREDLLFRINTIMLRVPPLRERPEDIPLLAEHFVERYCRRYDRPSASISAEAFDVLLRARWPGNVRELENAIERAVLVASGPVISRDDLPESLAARPTETDAFRLPAGWTLSDLERAAIVQTLDQARWNKQVAAARLGLYRPTLYSKMKKHGIARRPRGAGQGAAPDGQEA